MGNKKETVTLEIDGTNVESSKDVLIKNSDYFSAMFAGGFKESSQEIIKIQGVDLKSFNTILLLLWDESYVIEDHEIHLILQAASMLQFNAIKQLCESRIVEILKPSICLKIWKTAELLDLSPIWLRAKSMALEEFNDICDSTSILEFSLDDICSYLGHIYLCVKNELTVFQTAMNWWYENQEFYDKKDCTKVILRLLNCVNFNTLRDHEIKEMQSFPDVVDNAEITSILNCIIDLKENGINVASHFSEEELFNAIQLCNSMNRQRPEIPCILLQSDWADNPCSSKRMKCSDREERHVVIYDAVSNEFRNLFLIGGGKVRDLAGFNLLSYKEFVFLYGGEILIGVGNWNCNLWTYDTFKEKWERRNMLPHGRRHFQSIILDNCVYIVGGIGKFRVIQQNILWYDFKADRWSPVIPLPTEERYLKCCSFQGQLFVVDLSERCAYFFNKDLMSWRKVSMKIEKEFTDDIGNFAVFSDTNFLYLKGKFFIRFRLVGETLVPVSHRVMMNFDYQEIETVLCNGTVYTLYKCLNDYYNFSYTFESFNLETENLYYIFENKVQGQDTIEVDGRLFCLTQFTKLFSFNYYYLVKENICINNSIV